jgi:hypothetical protein
MINSRNIQLRASHYYVPIMGIILFGMFSLYVPALRLMLIHDDAANITWMNNFTVLSVFVVDVSKGATPRPVANVLWILVRELFGWYIPAILHAWNVLIHMLNVALVASFANRIGRRLGLRGWVFPILSALIFGLFPFSFQAVLWAGAIYHPVLAMGGLCTMHIYLTARQRNRLGWWVGCVLALIFTCLAHESGFMFGLLIAATELLFVFAGKRPLRIAPLLIGALSLAYPVLYRLLLPSMWGVSQPRDIAMMLQRVITNVPYIMQAMISWSIILLRTKIGLGQSSPLVITILFLVCMIPALVWLLRTRAMTIALIALAWWVALSVPMLLLYETYLLNSPRLLYTPAIGIALFWGAVTALLLQHLRHPVAKVVLAVPVVVMLAWCVPYITDRMDETERLTPAMETIDADLHASDKSAKVLFINLPEWSAPSYPAFLTGAEGMPIFQSADIPAWTWIYTVSGTRRETTYVRHDISLTRGDRYYYGIPGATINDTVLREKLLAANYIYRFDYDAPGLRARRLAILQMGDTDPVGALASFSQGDARTSLRAASAINCEGVVKADLTWAGVSGLTGPTGVFVHGFDAQNQQVAVADRDLVDGYLPLEMIPNGVVITETRIITALQGTAPMTQLRIGLYNRVNGERFAAAQANGVGWEGDEVVVPIQPKAENCGP